MPQTDATDPSTAAVLERGRSGPLDGGDAVWRILAVVSVLVCAAVTFSVMWGARWPAFPYDEVSTFQMSRLVAGQEVPEVIRGSGYYPAWAVLIAPIWWFTSDPSTVYQAALWIGLVVSMATIWPLAAIVRRFGPTTTQAVVISAFVMTLATRAVQADYALSERLLTLLAACVVVAAFRVADRPTVARHLVFAATLALMLFTHARVLAVVGAAVVWLLMRLGRSPRGATAVGLIATVVFSYAANWAGRAMNLALLDRSFNQGESLADRLTSRPSLFLRVGIGQAWYQSLASYGLVLVGLIVIIVAVWWQLRRARFGAETFLIGATVATVIISMLSWASYYSLFDNPWVRLDAWIYGRYIDTFGAVLTAIGAAVVLQGLTRAARRWVLGLTAVTALSAIAVLTPQVPTWGFVTPVHIPGILPWYRLLPEEPWPRDEWIVPSLTNENSVWLIAPLCVLAVLVSMMLLKRAPQIAAGVLMVLAVAGTLLADQGSDDFRAREDSYVPVIEELDALGVLDPSVSVGYALQCGRDGAVESAGENYFAYAVLPAELDRFKPTGTTEAEVVIACEDWPSGAADGARRLRAGATALESAVWVFPGDLQDELMRRGDLEPAGR